MDNLAVGSSSNPFNKKSVDVSGAIASAPQPTTAPTGFTNSANGCAFGNGFVDTTGSMA